MNENWFEAAIIVFIVVAIGVTVWSGGAANPEGTGSLGRKLSKLDGDMNGVKREMKGVKLEVNEMREGFRSLDQDLDELKIAAAARHQSLDHIKERVDMLYDHIVRKGMDA